MKLTFIEMRPFTVRWRKRGDDDSLRALQLDLLESADRGTPIPGCGILRKYRFADASRGEGKRGGLRVVYMHTPEAGCVHLIAVFGKDEKDDVPRDEIKSLCALARLLRDEVIAATNRRGRRL